MLLSSLLLLLVAAVFHAAANAFLKQATDKLAFAWWMLGIFCVVLAPAGFILPGSTDKIGWMLILASGLLEGIYFYTLSRAYSIGDLSLVYPVARGSAPLFLLCWAMIFLHERPSVIGLIGILCIVIGLYLINLRSVSEWASPLRGSRSSAARWALLTGFLISCYTAVDKAGVQYFSPLYYLYMILLVCWIVLSVQWLFPARRAALLREVESRKRAIAAVVSAILGTIAYFLVLAAMRLSPVSYVGPVREVSVVFGTWIGVRFMNETGGSLRIIASIFVAAGILLIALHG